MRKVPDELFTSLIYHTPAENQNSQCRRLTTFDLNPTGAAEGTLLSFPNAGCSLSEYLPTLIISLPEGSILNAGVKTKDGRWARGSWWAVNLIEGSWCAMPAAGGSAMPSPETALLSVWGSLELACGVVSAATPVVAERVRAIEAVASVSAAGVVFKGAAVVDAVAAGWGSAAIRETPLCPPTLGNHPLVFVLPEFACVSDLAPGG